MDFKKIIFFSLFSWSYIFGDSLYPSNFSLKNHSDAVDTAIKITVLWSSCWIFNKFIQHASSYPTAHASPTMLEKINIMWRKIKGGIHGVAQSGGLTMVTKTTVMTYAAWNLKNYYSLK